VSGFHQLAGGITSTKYIM